MKKALRILGSLIVSIVAAFYLFFFVGSLFEGEQISLGLESLGMMILSLLTVVSAVMNWVKVKVGVWVTLFVGLAFSIFGFLTAGGNKWMAIVGAGGPILVGGILVFLGVTEKKGA